MIAQDVLDMMKDIQEHQVFDLSGFDKNKVEEYTKASKDKFTAINQDGVAVASFGVNEDIRYNTGMAWGVVSSLAGEHFRGIHRAVVAYLAGCQYDSVYMTVRKDFKNGNRWAKMLGFEMEREIENMFEQSKTGILYRYRSAL